MKILEVENSRYNRSLLVLGLKKLKLKEQLMRKD